jgi:hypothetical protein
MEGTFEELTSTGATIVTTVNIASLQQQTTNKQTNKHTNIRRISVRKNDCSQKRLFAKTIVRTNDCSHKRLFAKTIEKLTSIGVVTTVNSVPPGRF